MPTIKFDGLPARHIDFNPNHEANGEFAPASGGSSKEVSYKAMASHSPEKLMEHAGSDNKATRKNAWSTASDRMATGKAPKEHYAALEKVMAKVESYGKPASYNHPSAMTAAKGVSGHAARQPQTNGASTGGFSFIGIDE